MCRVRRFVLGWVWRGVACVVALGYFFGICALGALHPPPRYERLPTPALVGTAIVSFVVAGTLHRLLATRWRAWKPNRSILATAMTVASVVVLVPLAIACWPVRFSCLCGAGPSPSPPSSGCSGWRT